MSCFEFRRAVMVDPRRLDPGARAHADSCPGCREFLARSLEFEDRLADAFRVPVPPGLGERLARAATASSFGVTRWYGLAASIVLAIALVAALAWPRNDPLALAGIDFVVFEESQAIADAKPADPAALRRIALEMGVSLPAQLGEVRYIGTCPFAGTTAHHVLVKSPFGKVTLLLIPERPLASRAVASARGLEAAVVPAVAGSVAIIAGSARGIARAETLLKSG
jgi:hypothetical protein